MANDPSQPRSIQDQIKQQQERNDIFRAKPPVPPIPATPYVPPQPTLGPQPIGSEDPTPEIATKVIAFTVFTSPDRLTKRFEVGADEQILKISGVTFSTGTARRIDVAYASAGDALRTLASHLDRLTSHEAIGLAVAKNGERENRITTKKRKLNGSAAKAAIARALENYDFPEGAGYLLVDGDGFTGLRSILISFNPIFAELAMLIRPSASAGIEHSGTGEILEGAGEHAYMVVDRVRRSRDILDALMRLSWKYGLGRYEIAANGRLLVRGPVDTSVASPERLIYEGRAEVIPPIIDTGKRVCAVVDGDVLNVEAFLAWAEKEAPEADFQERLRIARADPELHARQIQVLESCLAAQIITKVRTGTSQKQAEAEANKERRAFKPGQLAGDWPTVWLSASHVVVLASGEEVRLSEILRDPEAYDGKAIADPIEGVSYGRSTAVIYAGVQERGGPWIRSFAHGGVNFQIEPEKPTSNREALEQARLEAERLAEEKRQRQIEGGGGNGRNRGNGGNEDGGGDDDPEPPEPKPTPKPTPRKPRPRALLFKRFRDIDPTARKLWLLKGLIAAGELGYWFGPPGSLKSSLKVEMHVHLVRGEDWRGHRNKAGPCATVYFALERGDLVERRLAAYRERLTGPDGIVPDLPIVVVSRLINLMEPACVQVIVDTILDVQDEYGLPVRMATIDTVPKGISAGGGDENTAKDKGTAMANLRKIQDILTEVHLDLVGHSGKDETKGSRGSNTDVADADLLVQISTDGETRTATVIKANDRAEGPLFAFTGINHSFGEDEDGDPVAVHIIDPDAHVTQTPSRGGKPPRLTDAAKIALKALKKAIAETGQIPPKCNHIPHDALCTTEKSWRRYAYQMDISEGEDRAKQTAFSRAKEKLQAADVIEVWGQYIWIK